MTDLELAQEAQCTLQCLQRTATKSARGRAWAVGAAAALMLVMLALGCSSAKPALVSVIDERDVPRARGLLSIIKKPGVEAPTPISSRIDVGVSMGSVSIADRQKQVGAHIPIAMVFQPCFNVLDNWDYEITRRQNQGHEIVLVMEFNETSKKESGLEMILRGGYDAKLKAIGKRMSKMKDLMWVRILHEFNSDWYPWGTFKDGNSIPKFKKSFRHIVDLLRANGAGDNIKFQISYNAKSVHGDKIPFSAWWPGDEYVDMIMTTAYNRAGDSEGSNKPFLQFSEFFPDSYKRVAALHPTLPIGIAECGSTDADGEKAKGEWYLNTFKTLKTSDQFPRLKQVNFFMENKFLDWQLTTRQQQIAFGNGMRLLGYKAIKREGE